jgi:triphosphoribosyl-dephospho-CoA synthase
VDAVAFLDARDARAALVSEVLRSARARGTPTVAWISTNVPGPDKRPEGLVRVFGRTIAAAKTRLPAAEIAVEGDDLLGPYAALFVAGAPADVKRSAVGLEEETRAGRLIDIDVYDPEGSPWDRARLALPQRVCLVCDEPARDCIRLKRHAPRELAAAVAALLAPNGGADALARCLVDGARLELALTPKPGLVDRQDNGSHPDLSYSLMMQSIALLPLYFDELLALRRGGAPLEACVEAGRCAERRMFDAIGANAHRGYIFLSGLLLIAACDTEGAPAPPEARRATGRAAETAGFAAAKLDALRARVRTLAREFFGRRPAGGSETFPTGRHGGDGIRAEALAGLPSIFDAGLPALRGSLRETGDFTRSSYALLGVLMQRVDDTTAIARCGPDGLAQLKRDGAELSRLVDTGASLIPFLEALNDVYRRRRLTMGGVADCMAVVFAFHQLGAASASAGAL